MLLTKIKAGSLLIAEPSVIGDLSFQRSVVMIANHDNEGSIGFILNKPLTYTLSDIVPTVKNEFRIFNGGPVEEDSLYFIHNVPNLVPNSVEIVNGVYWGGDFDLVVKLIKDNVIGEDNVKFFLGYSGWGKDQLFEEIQTNSWALSEDVQVKDVINISAIDCWKNQMLALGGEYRLWANAPENPSHN